jgi:hypothetical protein
VRIRWNEQKSAAVLEAETPNDYFALGKLYGRLPALRRDCVQGVETPGEQIILTVPISYMITELLKE